MLIKLGKNNRTYLLIVIIAIIVGVGIWLQQNKKDIKPIQQEETQTPSQIENNTIELNEEPIINNKEDKEPLIEEVVFTEHIFELDKAEYIVPLGDLTGGWEEMESNNLVLIEIKRPGGYNTPSETMEIYAPTKMSLVSYSYYSFKGSDPSWTLIFRITKDVTLKLSVLTGVSDIIKNAVGTEHTQGEINLSKPILFEPGQIIGHSGGTIGTHNWDIFLYDKKHNNEFVNQERYENNYMGERYRTAACPFDFYPESMRKEYIKLFGTNAPGLTSSCGSASRDVAGTLSGIWFLKETGIEQGEKGMYTTPLFIYSNTAGGTSIGFINKKRYSMAPDNPTNRDPADITDEHCYSFIDPYYQTPDGYAYFKIISDMEMRLSSGTSGSCPDSFPQEFKTYYR